LTTEESQWLDNTLAGLATGKQSTIEDQLVAADLADKVLATLPPDDRLILMLIDVDHAPVKEVAEMTGWSESKVKVKAFRARRRMRQAVEKLLKAGS
jgi:RNA polymerase sigma-70 factor, ECF subfamily